MKNNKKLFTRRLTGFFSQLENSCLPRKKAFTQSVRANELLFSALEKKYTKSDTDTQMETTTIGDKMS